MKTIELTDEQREMIVKAIRNTCRNIEEHQMIINTPSFDIYPDISSIRENMHRDKLMYQTLLNYIEQV